MTIRPERLAERDRLATLTTILAAGYLANPEARLDWLPVGLLTDLAEKILDEAKVRTP